MKSSWVKVVHNGPALLENVLDVEMAEGKEVVSVHDSVIQDSVPLWDDLLERKFMAKAPHVAKIHIIVNKIWPIDDASIKIDVFEVNEVTVKFWIKDSATRKRLLKRGMWNIANVPRILSKWSPIEEENEEEEIKVTPMLHPDKVLCKSFEKAKVFVEKNAPFSQNKAISARMSSKNENTSKERSKWKSIADCRANGKALQTAEVDQQVGVESVAKNVVEEAVGTVSQLAQQEDVSLNQPDSTSPKEKAPETKEVVAETKEVVPSTREEKIGWSWSDVSPAKVGRSGSRTNIVTQIVGSPSRFVVLPEESVSNEELSEETDTEKVKENKKEEAQTKNLKDQTVLSAKETISSTIGRKKNTKKK
ncbi:hypothetical protein N665_0023s0037 [Sinapis alba]|nr:hypothetical protein N665_0023s0037 [Sinapis alba]